MASITDKYSSEEAALGAFEAGADIILMPMDFEEAYKNMEKRAKDLLVQNLCRNKNFLRKNKTNQER